MNNEEHHEYKYTIVIPHHEIPQLLKRCVESIPERDDIQIIVVDDNSKDNEKYLDMYPFLRRKNLEYYPTKEGKGAGYARNVGLDHAKGKWLLFCDSDDLFTEGLSDILDDMYESPNDITFFNVETAYSDDISKKWDEFKMTQRLFDQYEKTGDMTCVKLYYSQPWGKIIRRKIAEDNNIRFDELKLCNDWWFCVQVAFLAKTVAIDYRYLYIYTHRRGSLSYKCFADKEDALIRLDVMERVQVFVAKYGVEENPMMIRSTMVLIMRRYPLNFIKEVFALPFKGISIFKFLYQMFAPKYYRRNMPKKMAE